MLGIENVVRFCYDEYSTAEQKDKPLTLLLPSKGSKASLNLTPIRNYKVRIGNRYKVISLYQPRIPMSMLGTNLVGFGHIGGGGAGLEYILWIRIRPF